MAAGVVDGVIVVQACAGQFDWPALLLGRSERVLEVARDFFTTCHRRPKAHHVDVGNDGARGRDDDLVTRSGERTVRGRELLGPLAPVNRKGILAI